MEEFIYNLLLKSTQGLALLGTFKYRLASTMPLKREAADVEALMKQVQQQNTIDLTVYQIEGSVSIPLLTGFAAVPLSGIILLGPLVPITAIMSSTDPNRNVFFQFNDLDTDQIAGGLVWRPGEPGELIFAALGRRLQLPA